MFRLKVFKLLLVCLFHVVISVIGGEIRCFSFVDFVHRFGFELIDYSLGGISWKYSDFISCQ